MKKLVIYNGGEHDALYQEVLALVIGEGEIKVKDAPVKTLHLSLILDDGTRVERRDVPHEDDKILDLKKNDHPYYEEFNMMTSEVNEKIKLLTDSNSSLQSKVNELTNSNAVLQTESTTLKSANAALTSSNAALTSSNAALQTQVTNLTSENATLQAKVNELTPKA